MADEHENEIELVQVRPRRSDVLLAVIINNVIVNNIFLTLNHKSKTIAKAMKSLADDLSSQYAQFANVGFDALRKAGPDFPPNLNLYDIAKMSMRSPIQLCHGVNLQVIANIISTVHDESKSLSGADLSAWLKKEVKEHREHIEAWIDPRMKAAIKEQGGEKKDAVAGYKKLKKAGRADRLELWYAYFNQFPLLICQEIFAMTADVFPFEYIWACEEPNEVIKTYRKALEYIFGELCESSFVFVALPAAERKGPQASGRVQRTQRFKKMCFDEYYRSLGLPKDFKDYPVKDAATWPKKRSRSTDSVVNGGAEAAKKRRVSGGGSAEILKTLKR